MNSFDVSGALAMPTLSEYLTRFEEQVLASVHTNNATLHEAISRLLAVRGKRLRPSLTIACAASHGGAVDAKVLQAAVAIELVHLSSLIHDDIIDNAQTRWNIPTINTHEGVNTAILAGDFLLARACALATAVSPAVGAVVANAITTLCEGQMQELADQYQTTRTFEHMLDAIHGKTAALLSAACEVGGLCGNVPMASVQAFTKYGEAFGMAFQLIDDVLDCTSTPEKLGKATGNDIREGTYTMPLILALQGEHRMEVEKLLETARKDPAALIAFLQSIGVFQATIDRAHAYNVAATVSLSKVPKTPITEALSTFPEHYTNWALGQ